MRQSNAAMSGALTPWGVTAAALLVGISAGMAVLAVASRLALREGDARVPVLVTLLAGCSLLAAGIFLPRYLVYAIIRLIERHWSDSRGRERLTMILLSPRDGDATFRRAGVAVFALAGGLLAAGLPLGIRAVDAIRDLLFDTFVWSWPALVGLNAILVMCLLAVPLFFMGGTLLLLHRYAAAAPQNPSGVVPAGAIGVLVGALACMSTTASATALAASPLPLLIVAAAAGWSSTRAR